MATMTVANVVSATLTMLVVDTVTCSRPFRWALVTNRSGNEIWVRSDGTDPTVGGDESFVVLASDRRDFNYADSTGADIRLVSSLASCTARTG